MKKFRLGLKYAQQTGNIAAVVLIFVKFALFYLSIAQTIVLFHAIKIVVFSLYMVSWFEKVKGILILGGNGKNEMLTSLAEDFFNMLLVKNILIIKYVVCICENNYY